MKGVLSKPVTSIFPPTSPLVPPHNQLYWTSGGIMEDKVVPEEPHPDLTPVQLLSSMMKSHHYSPNEWGEKEEESLLARFAPSGESQIQVIEWNMMDKWKFYPLSMLSSFSIRCLLYPFTLVKTKMQIQQRNSVYSGMWDCIRKIVDSEGLRGLYRGFWVSAFQIVSGVFYVSTYEGVRLTLYQHGIRDRQVPYFLYVTINC